MGIHIDDPPEGTASTVVRYREGEAAEWRDGHPLAVLSDGRLKGSLFRLGPSTSYDVEVDALDAGGAELATYACTAATDPLRPPHSDARTIHVSVLALPGGDGSEAHPFATIQEGVGAAGPGDTVRVHPGVYREAVEFAAPGEPGALIKVVGDEGAILDGSDKMIELGTLAWDTDPADANVHFAPFTGTPGYVAVNGARFYHYESLESLRAGLGHDGVPMAEGWFADGSALWIRFLTCPCESIWNVPVLERAFTLSGVGHVWIEGFEVRYYGSGEYGTAFYLRDASNCVVRRNRVHGLPTAVRVAAREGTVADRNLIEENWIADPPVGTWPWAAVKGTDHECTAIEIGGGAGNVVRHNRIEDVFNGVYVGSWDALEDEAIGFETDVYENVLRTIGDDGLEPEGACVNVRMWRNAADGVHNGVSLAPITVGPAWVVRNRFTGYDESGFKVSNDSSGPVFLYHNTCWTDRPDQNGMNVSGNFTNMTFRNNIVRGTRYALESTIAVTGVDLDHDDWHTTRTGEPHFKWDDVRYDTIAALCAATAQECHGTEAEPGLLDPATLRFGLAPGSANIDSALPLAGLNDGFAGEGPDRGYAEVGDVEPAW
jgi:hypothetical protein